MIAGTREDGPTLRLVDGGVAGHAIRNAEAEVLLKQDLPSKIPTVTRKTLLNFRKSPVGTVSLKDAEGEQRVRISEFLKRGEIGVEISPRGFHRRENKHRSIGIWHGYSPA